MLVFRMMDLHNTVLGWLRGDGYQEDSRLPCRRHCGLIVHDKPIYGLRVCSLPDGEGGKHGMLLKARNWLPFCLVSGFEKNSQSRVANRSKRWEMVPRHHHAHGPSETTATGISGNSRSDPEAIPRRTENVLEHRAVPWIMGGLRSP
jgi:hypothetical protein